MIETKKYKGFTIEIFTDPDPLNPRTDWDNHTEMILFSNNYTLGDQDHGIDPDKYSGWHEMEAVLSRKAAAILPVYMYSHSGITINTTGFPCSWDSGQIGFIRIKKEVAAENYPDYDKERLCEILVGDVETYDKYLTNSVVGYSVKDTAGDEIEACHGYYDIECAMKEAESVVDAYWKDKHELFDQAGVEVELPA
jgi:hypothetical protein